VTSLRNQAIACLVVCALLQGLPARAADTPLSIEAANACLIGGAVWLAFARRA